MRKLPIYIIDESCQCQSQIWMSKEGWEWFPYVNNIHVILIHMEPTEKAQSHSLPWKCSASLSIEVVEFFR